MASSPSTTTHTFQAIVSRGAEEACAQELRQLGLQRVVAERGAVRFLGPLADGYRACLWSRIASRILLRLERFHATTPDDLYAGIHRLDWADHLSAGGTLWVDFVGTSKQLRHTNFSAQRTKDAIVDRLRTPSGVRPSVQRESPDLRLHLHLGDGAVTVSVDLSGEALHWRTPDRRMTEAPLKETLAATLLGLADWRRLARRDAPLVDPMCGSGTVLLEAAGIAADVAPGLQRVPAQWGFTRWRGHAVDTWRALLAEARERQAAGRARPVQVWGSDMDVEALDVTWHNARQLGLEGAIRLKRAPVSALRPPPGTTQPGVVVTNPPYGARLGESEAAVADVYRQLGDALRWEMLGWSAYVLAPAGPLSHAVGLRTRQRHILHNGPLECRLLVFDIHPEAPAGVRDAPAPAGPPRPHGTG